MRSSGVSLVGSPFAVVRAAQASAARGWLPPTGLQLSRATLVWPRFGWTVRVSLLVRRAAAAVSATAARAVSATGALTADAAAIALVAVVAATGAAAIRNPASAALAVVPIAIM